MLSCQQLMKRTFDVLVAFLGLVVLSPIMVISALLVWVDMGRPIFYRQTRPGLAGLPFMICKLRTMSDEHDVDGQLLPPEQRLTGLGRLLRTASIDELPQLWNVLKGDMSLVGPRPLLMEYLDRYTPEQARRHEVRPGITGWAQVNGRNSLDWEERFRLDVWYVGHYGFWLDVRILCSTVLNLFRRGGVNFAGDRVSNRFQGASGDSCKKGTTGTDR